MLPETSFESVRHFTHVEFAKLARAHKGPERLELLNGRIVMNPPAGWPAGEVGASVVAALSAHVRPRGLGRVFGGDQGFELPSGDTVSSDAAFISTERWDASTPPEEGAFLRIVPELVVEVLSPSTAAYDRGEKKLIYERNGVQEYWIIDPRARRAWQFVRTGERFEEPRVLEATDTLESSVIAGLSLPLKDVFAA